MKIVTMDKVQKIQWDEMREHVKSTNETIILLKLKLLGNDDLEIGGMSRQVTDLVREFDKHDYSDTKRFDALETHNKVTRAWIGGAVFVIGVLWSLAEFVFK